MSFKYVRETIADAAKTLSVVAKLADKFCEVDPINMVLELELPDPIGYELVKRMNNANRKKQIEIIKATARNLLLISKEPYIETVFDNQVFLDVRDSYVDDSTDSIICLIQKALIQEIPAEDIVIEEDAGKVRYRAGVNFIVLPDDRDLRYIKAETNDETFVPYFQVLLPGAEVVHEGQNLLRLEYEYYGKQGVLIIKKLGDSQGVYISDSDWTIPAVDGSTLLFVQSLVVAEVVPECAH